MTFLIEIDDNYESFDPSVQRSLMCQFEHCRKHRLDLVSSSRIISIKN